MSLKDKEEDWRQALENLRIRIDGIDDHLLDLLAERQELAAEIGRLKMRRGVEVFDWGREEEVLRRLMSKNQTLLSSAAIRNIFSQVISAARLVQRPLSVAYLGPEGTFSQQAGMSLFGLSATFCPANTFEDIFAWVEKRSCDVGVVPLENSLEGSVRTIFDLLYRHDLKIGAEIFLRIRHHLLTRADHISSITHLYSHPMALAQCRSWIRTNLPHVVMKEVDSTAAAAQRAQEEPFSAAIGNKWIAQKYPSLSVLTESIEDYPHNVTRFAAVGKLDPEPTGKDKTSFIFSLNHEPGMLYRALEPLARRQINVTRIESTPLKPRSWEYLFFVDIEGHVLSENVGEALTEMKARCSFFKFLGSYPAGGDPWE
jgi:chorismate mutase/prephenate dehydratase